MVYTLTINRAIFYEGTVDIKAESPEEAKRKYFRPNPEWNEHLIFDDEIDWDEYNAEYTVLNVTEKEG